MCTHHQTETQTLNLWPFLKYMSATWGCAHPYAHTNTHRYHCSVSKLQLRELQLCLCPFQEKVSTQRHSLTSGKTHRRAALPRTSSKIICTACLSRVCVRVNADGKPLEVHLSVVRATQSVLDDALTNHHCVFSECLEITMFKGTKQFDFCLWTVFTVHVVKHTSVWCPQLRLSESPSSFRLCLWPSSHKHIEFERGEAGCCCCEDQLLSVTASHSIHLQSNWLWNEGGRCCFWKGG